MTVVVVTKARLVNDEEVQETEEERQYLNASSSWLLSMSTCLFKVST
jgi:hypothetical protein